MQLAKQLKLGDCYLGLKCGEEGVCVHDECKTTGACVDDSECCDNSVIYVGN